MVKVIFIGLFINKFFFFSETKNSVKIPVVQLKRPKAYRTVTGELSTISGNATVTVTPEGDVTIKKTKMY